MNTSADKTYRTCEELEGCVVEVITQGAEPRAVFVGGVKVDLKNFDNVCTYKGLVGGRPKKLPSAFVVGCTSGLVIFMFAFGICKAYSYQQPVWLSSSWSFLSIVITYAWVKLVRFLTVAGA